MSKYVNFNDKTLPLGKRKVAYVKWAVSKGTELIEAQRQSNNKFGYSETSNTHKRCRMCGEQHYLWDNGTCAYCIREHRLNSPSLDKYDQSQRKSNE